MSPPEPTIILITGLPGSGKTFFANRLSKALDLPHFNSDQVRKDLGYSGHYTMKDRMAVYHHLAKAAEKEISRKQSVIVDATFQRHSMLEIFTRLAHDLMCKLRIIEILASDDLIIARVGKKRADSEADVKVFQKLKDQSETLSVPHFVLESKEDNIQSMIRSAIEYLELA